jgi:hypothetical protein
MIYTSNNWEENKQSKKLRQSQETEGENNTPLKIGKSEEKSRRFML